MALDRISMTAFENFAIERIVIIQGDNGFEMSTAFLTIELCEGISNGLMTGTISFNDDVNIFDTQLNLRGDEVIELSFYSKRPDLTKAARFAKKFRINSYDDVAHSSTMAKRIVTMKIESIGSINNEFMTISKSFSNTGAHAIVAEMLEAIGYPTDVQNIEPTLYNRDIVIPNITPLEVIGHLSALVQSGDSNSKGDSNFYFFESRDKVNFVSGSTLLRADPVASLVYDHENDSVMYNRVLKYHRVRGMNLRQQIRDGGLGCSVHSHSLVDKRMKVTPVAASGVKKIYKSMNSDNWYGGSITDNVNVVNLISTEDQMYKFINMGSNGNSVGIRRVNRSSLLAKRSLASISGNTDITSGSIIELKTPDLNGGTNTRDSGRWLVNRIVHKITRESYTMDLELISDSDLRRY